MLDSEAAAIRMDLKRALIRIGEMESAMGKLQDDNARLKDENARLKKDNARLEARLAFYGSANMSSSTTSIYNAARKKFRKGRGEKVSGNPGEKIKGSSEGMGAMAAKARMAAAATATADRKRLPESGPLRGMREYLMTTSPSLPCATRSRPSRALAATSNWFPPGRRAS